MVFKHSFFNFQIQKKFLTYEGMLAKFLFNNIG